MKNFIFKSSSPDLHKIYDLVKILGNEQRMQREDLQNMRKSLKRLITLISESPSDEAPDLESEALHGDSERAD